MKVKEITKTATCKRCGAFHSVRAGVPLQGLVCGRFVEGRRCGGRLQK